MKGKLFSAALAALTLSVSAQPACANEASHWSYDGDTAPQNWSKLSPDFYLCEQGKAQSPIDIKDALQVHPRPLKLSYQLPPVSVINNGHSVQVNVQQGDFVTLDGEKFVLQQFHFHSPSENTLNGKSFPMEAHFVHMNAEGEIAVIAVMFETGKANAGLEKIWQQMPDKAGEPVALKTKVDLLSLMPKDLTHYRFSGSLTTPPCTEGVRWLVVKEPQTLSETQLEKFQHAMHHANNHPVQGLHGRVIVAQ
ncbi:carbonic anhydrase family protein [Rahnella perminowiae]|uniref:carbonic anhydrase n=1 Tax=Rahnella perminowiae TaxID=2816244 RepID=UPI00224A5D9B|nr:carbonic anhydrase family protein [Rahnella perminowiae]MCX2945329.1 carbonic anhydrase family protein [Rahnella perminowiae]